MTGTGETVANVYDAMKKSQAQQAARRPPGQPEGEAWAGAAAAGPTQLYRPPLGRCARNVVIPYDPAGRIAEEYRALRDNLCCQFREKKFCLLVTSAEPREGKTLTCLNLAFALAEDRDRRTVVVDCNLRRPQVAALLRTAAAPGVADVLRRAATLADVTWNTMAPNLFAIPAGRAVAYEVGDLLRSPVLDDVVADLRHQFDYVLVDSPPIRVAPDVGFLGRAATQALLVVRLRKTRRPSVSRAIALLHAANIKPLGLALTCR